MLDVTCLSDDGEGNLADGDVQIRLVSQEVTLSVKRRSVDLDGDSETWEVDWLRWYAYASGRMEKDGSERCSCAVTTLTG